MFDTNIPLYGTFIIIGIACGLYFIYRDTSHIDLKKEEKMGLLIYILIGSIIGAKYFSYFVNPQKYGMFEFEKIGLSSYGAVIGILIMLFIYSKQYKIQYKRLIGVVIKAIPLMYGVGKIGCFVAGCCYGIEYDGPLNIIYKYSISAPNGIGLFPIQALEAIVFILIFIYFSLKKNKKNIIGEAFIICGISKFLLDYLRMSHNGVTLSINQVVSLFFIIVGICLLFKKIK